MEKLSDMPNIGKELAERLARVGIENPNELQSIGSCDAFVRLYTVDSSACINTLYALEGAIQGIRWHKLDKNKKSELLQFMNRIRLVE